MIATAEVVRTTSVDASEYQQQIQKLREFLANNPFQSTESTQKLTEVLQAVREIMNLEMQSAGRSFQLPGFVTHMEAARADLLSFHLNDEFQKKATTVSQEAPAGTDFPIELARDVAKYLDKLGKLTGDVIYHVLAAEALTAATSAIDQKLSLKEKIVPGPGLDSYFLAHFERLIQLDLSQAVKVDPDEVMLYAKLSAAQDRKDGQIQNWDRQAAVGWWLYEYGMRHGIFEAIGYGLTRVSEATKASNGKKTKLGYIAARMVANWYEMHRGGEFNVANPETQIDIKQKLDLPRKET